MYCRLSTFIIFIALLVSCNTNTKEKTLLSSKHGGTIHINEPDFDWNLNPHQINSQGDVTIAEQIYEGLLRYNPKNLTLAPALAKYWIFKNNGKDYIFFLRTNAFFHKNECFKNVDKTRKIAANDFKFSFENLCTYSQKQKTIPLQMNEIIGAKDFFNASKKGIKIDGIKGIQVLNDSTLQISINEPNSLFINYLAEISMVVIPKEAVDLYGDAIYTGSGPFYLKSFKKRPKKLTLYRNENYYFRNFENFSLPYFDKIEVNFINSVDKEIELFEKGMLDIIFEIPSKVITPFLNGHIDDFKGENAKYVLIKDKSGGIEPTYILQYNYVKNFVSNRHNIIDFTRVYFQKSFN